MTLGSVIIVIG